VDQHVGRGVVAGDPLRGDLVRERAQDEQLEHRGQRPGNGSRITMITGVRNRKGGAQSVGQITLRDRFRSTASAQVSAVVPALPGGARLCGGLLRGFWRAQGHRPGAARRRAGRSPPLFTERGLYGRIRHPLTAGFVVVFWSAPTMTAGHLLFAAAATGYILVGIAFEEHDLIHSLGDTYTAYRARVPALFPRPSLRRRC